MSDHKSVVPAIGVAAAVLVAVDGSAVGQDTFRWTGAAGTTVWTDPLNWFNETTGMVDAAPDADDDVEFPVDARVTGGGARDVRVDQNVTLTFGTGQNNGTTSSTFVAGTIFNHGLITFTADGVDNNIFALDQRILVPNNTETLLTGDGTLALNGIETGISGQDRSTSIFTHAAGHTITGSGSFQTLTLNNRGSIFASEALRLLNTIVNNDGGLIDLDDGTVLLIDGSSSVSGGAVSGAGDARIEASGNAGLSDSTLTGQFAIGNGVDNGNLLSSLTLSGVLANDAALTFTVDNTDNNIFRLDQRLFVAADQSASLEGTGTLTLSGLETGLEGNDRQASRLVNGANHTIDGSGTFSNIVVENRGSINADRVLALRSGTIENADGLVTVTAAGEITLDPSSGIEGGEILGEGGRLNGSGNTRLADLTLSGTFDLGNGLENDATLSSISIFGTITNDAAVTFTDDAVNNNGFRLDQRLFVAAGETSTLGGDGRITFSGRQTGIEGGDRNTSTVVNGADHTLTGTGSLSNIIVENRGTVEVTGATALLAAAVGNAGGLIDIGTNAVLVVDTNSSIAGGLIDGSGGRLFGRDNAGLRDATLTGGLVIGNDVANSSEVSSLVLGGTITNDADLVFAADDTNNNAFALDQALAVVSGDTVTIEGTGTIATNGFETGFQGATSGGDEPSVLGNAADHTIAIRNDGVLQNIRVDNAGTIAVESGLFFLRSSVLTGGTLSGVFGSRVDSSGNTLISNLTTTGELLFGSDQANGAVASTTISGTITNEGVITFTPDAVDNNGFVIDQNLFIAGGTSAELAGSGVVRLAGVETGFEGATTATSTLTNGEDHAIVGSGSVQDITLMNRGLLNATGVVRLSNTKVQNDGGTFEIGAAGVLTMNASSAIAGGTIAGEEGGRISGSPNSRLENVTTTGSIRLGSGEVNGVLSSTTIEGVITNNGRLAFTPDAVDNNVFAIDQRLFVAQETTATLSGNGTFELTGADTGFQGGNRTTAVLTNDAGHTIFGEGSFASIALRNLGSIEASGGVIDFSNAQVTGVSGSVTIAADSKVSVTTNVTLFQQGSITLESGTSEFDFQGQRLEVTEYTGDLMLERGVFAPGAGGIAASSVTGDLTQLARGTGLEIELAGRASGSFDTLMVGGDLTLLGSLDLVLLDGFVPAGNETFLIIEVGGTRSGLFDRLDEGDLVTSVGAIDLFITYAAGDGNDIALIAVPAPGVAAAMLFGGTIAARRRRTA